MNRQTSVPLSLAALLVAALLGCRRPAPHPTPSPPAPDASGYPLTLKDDRGKSWRLDRRPQRVVSLAPSVTEVLFALGAGAQVVGVTDYCDFPPEAQQKEKVGGFKTQSLEKIISLRPDVVVAARGVPQPIMEALESRGVVVFAILHDTLAQVLDSVTTLGKVVGREPEARAVRTALDKRVAAVRQRTSKLTEAERPTLLYVISRDPVIYTAGPGNFVDDLISAAGGRNVAADANQAWLQYSLETLVERDPEVLLFSAGPMGGYEALREKTLRELRGDKRWRGLRAVVSGRVYMLNEDHLGVPGPRLVDGLEELAHVLHPELFREQ